MQVGQLIKHTHRVICCCTEERWVRVGRVAHRIASSGAILAAFLLSAFAASSRRCAISFFTSWSRHCFRSPLAAASSTRSACTASWRSARITRLVTFVKSRQKMREGSCTESPQSRASHTGSTLMVIVVSATLVLKISDRRQGNAKHRRRKRGHRVTSVTGISPAPRPPRPPGPPPPGRLPPDRPARAWTARKQIFQHPGPKEDQTQH